MSHPVHAGYGTLVLCKIKCSYLLSHLSCHLCLSGIGIHVALTGFKLSVQPGMTLHSWSSGLSLMIAKITGTWLHVLGRTGDGIPDGTCTC